VQLNNEQQRAVTHPGGPLLILAGAGSGKTRVLTHRIAYLIKEKGVDPDKILAVTFTNKAAAEMKERVQKLSGVIQGSMWVSTFHSFCLRVLRRNAKKLGYKDNFVIFDEADQIALIKLCLKELNISEDIIAPNSAVNRISRAKDEYIFPKKFEEDASDFWNKNFATLYSLYQVKLFKQNAMDFGDLIANVLRLFEADSQTLEFFQYRFEYVLVDEYQDTNHVQYRLVKLLAEKHKNILVVGDEDQSIYRWRGADINNILEFKDDFPGADIIKLEQNYRSTPTILKAANSVIKNNKTRIGKNLWSSLPDMEKVKVVQKLGDLEEARYIASEVKKLGDQGYRYDDMAIFYRTNAQSRVFEECFRNSGIPYVIFGGIKFYERMEIKDVLSYLKFIMEKENDTALLRVINVPPRGIGKSSLEKIKDYSRGRDCSIYEGICDMVGKGLLASRITKNLALFVRLVEDLEAQMDSMPLGEFTNYLVNSSGYVDFYKNSKSFDAADRLENIQEFIRATYEFKEPAKESLSLFLDQVALVSDVDRMDDQKGAIPLMTVHLAKGLEFPIVFLVGMEEGLFPHTRSMDSDDEIEEERRLCYVGMTRAMEKLYMVYASKRRIYGREQYNMPSRFLDEIDKDCVSKPYKETYSHSYDYNKVKTSQINTTVYDECFDQRPEEEKSEGLKVGSKVAHPVFGNGVVQKVDGKGENQKVMVRFMNGQLKTLVVKYAQLKQLGSDPYRSA